MVDENIISENGDLGFLHFKRILIFRFKKQT